MFVHLRDEGQFLQTDFADTGPNLPFALSMPKSLYLWIEISSIDLKFRPVIRIDNRSFQKLPFQN